MRKFTIWNLATTLAFLASLSACSNSSSSSADDYDDLISANNSKDDGKSNSSTNPYTCNTLNTELPAPTNFSAAKETDSSWTLTWDYTRNDSRAETGFKIESLDMDSKDPKWESEGTTNADVTIYKLKGAKKVGKYYRVMATDKCGSSKESNRIQISADGNSTSVSDTTTVSLDVPTDVAITRIAPSVWELSWKYSDLKDDPNRFFVIQTSKLKDFKWTSIKSKINGNVRNYYIQGRDQIETYFRLAVVNSGDTSAFTEAVQLTPDIAYRDYMSLNVPVPSTKITMFYSTAFEADRDTSTKDDKSFVSATATYTITDNFISKYIYESDYTKSVYYEARWFTSLENYNFYKGSCQGMKKSDKCDSCYWDEKFPYEEPSISKSIDAYSDFSDAKKTKKVFAACSTSFGYIPSDHSKLFDADTSAAHKAEWNKIMDREYNMSMCLLSYIRGLCDYYVQLRIVWVDKNGEMDWSEWTQPFNISDISGADNICNTL